MDGGDGTTEAHEEQRAGLERLLVGGDAAQERVHGDPLALLRQTAEHLGDLEGQPAAHPRRQDRQGANISELLLSGRRRGGAPSDDRLAIPKRQQRGVEVAVRFVRVLEGRSHVEVGDSGHGKCREFQRELSHTSRLGGRVEAG